MPSIALEQEAIAAAIALVILYWHASDVHQHRHVQPKPSSNFALRHWLPK